MVGSLSRVGMRRFQDMYGLRSCRCLLWEVFSQDTLDYLIWKISLDADKFNSINNLEIYIPSCTYIILSLVYFLPELGTQCKSPTPARNKTGKKKACKICQCDLSRLGDKKKDSANTDEKKKHLCCYNRHNYLSVITYCSPVASCSTLLFQLVKARRH